MLSRMAGLLVSSLMVLALLFSSVPGLAAPATGAAVSGLGFAPGGPQADQVDCSQIAALGIDRQMNLRAAQIRMACGLEQPGSVISSAGATSDSPVPTNLGGTDVQVNNALADTFPHVTQSESSIAAHGSTVVAAYNSSTAAPGNYSGVSYSTDGGTTFSEIRPSPFASGHGTNYGDPIALFSARIQRFYTFWLVSGGDCGVQGIGMWYSGDGQSWTTGSCVHVNSDDDREAAWVDNNPSSIFYGSIYVSYNDFSAGGAQRLFVTRSTDDGTTWSSPIALTAGFIRDGQLTGGPDGTVLLAGMDEGGGGTNPRQNIAYVSTDGGLTFAGHTMGAPFPAPGDISCTSYFRAVTPIWRFMGYGQPGIGPGGVMHYVYTAGAAGDAGDTLYVRSTDNGATWSAPLRLNQDAGTRTQWMPSLAVTVNGRVLASWYDRRNTSNDDYQRYARVSLDNGLTWQPDTALSDQIITQPQQPDPNVSSCYAGDYDTHVADGNAVYAGWTDGRVQINATHQQDVYLDKVDFGPTSVCTPIGAAGWQVVAGLPQGVYGPAVMTDGRYVYAAGGNDLNTGDLPQFARYDPATNAWTALAPLPVAVDMAAAAYANGKIYVFGGIASNVVQGLTQIYDIAGGTWSSGAPMPDVRSHAMAGAYNGRLYLAGGYSTTSVVAGSVWDQTWEYNPATNTWATKATMPAALGGAAYAVIGAKLYVAGGRDVASVALSTLYAYDLGTNTWSTLASLPVAVNVAGATALNGKLWVMGGGTPFLDVRSRPDAATKAPQPDMLADTQIYDPATNTWSAGPAQSVPRSFQGAATVGLTIVSVGGYNGYAVPMTEIPTQRRLRTLLLYADGPEPITLRNSLLALPTVSQVDLFNARLATPTAAQLQGYDLVVAWSNYTYADDITLGNELADYADAGGAVMEFTFNFSGVAGYVLGGRWESSGYSAFNVRTTTMFSTASLGTLNVPGSPLLAGVNALSAYWREVTTPSAGATQIAEWTDANPAIAFKSRAAGVTGYFGDSLPQWSGYAAQLVANAGLSLRARNTCATVEMPATLANATNP